jgi:hypothetical protein
MEDYSNSDSDEDDIRDYMRVRLIREREILKSHGILGPNTMSNQESQTWSSQTEATNVNISDYITHNQNSTANEEAPTAPRVMVGINVSSAQKLGRELTNPDNAIF